MKNCISSHKNFLTSNQWIKFKIYVAFLRSADCCDFFACDEMPKIVSQIGS